MQEETLSSTTCLQQTLIVNNRSYIATTALKSSGLNFVKWWLVLCYIILSTKMIGKSFFLCYILIVLPICIQGETEKSVVYYVSPTEPHSSCLGSSSCPSGQLCHTMDYLAEHSSQFFSPDHINITLTLLCGIHNCTKDLTVQNVLITRWSLKEK